MEDLSDNEREEQIRKWWADNWLWIVGGIALGLALLGGWQYWKSYKERTAESAGAAYEAVIGLLGSNNRDEAAKKAADLRAVNPKSPYADQAELALARAAVEARDYDKAVTYLKGVADASRDPQLRQVARTRQARVLQAQGKYDESVALLDPAQAGSFAAVYHEIRGDALAAKGDGAGARREYEAALAAAKDSTLIDRAYVELKRDALPAAPAVKSAP